MAILQRNKKDISMPKFSKLSLLPLLLSLLMMLLLNYECFVLSWFSNQLEFIFIAGHKTHEI